MNNKPPSQYDVESFLDDQLKHGDRESIAAILDVSPSLISQEVNPNATEKKSKYYQGIRFLWAVYQVSESLGDQLLAKINCLAQTWKRKSHRPQNIANLAGKCTTETTDIILAELNKRPFQERLSEAIQARAAIDEYIVAIRFDGIEDAADISERAS